MPDLLTGFEPTYEGLKHFTHPTSSSTPASFEPTYEGLKLTSRARFELPPSGFEPTYEGLKPFSRLDKKSITR